MSRRRLDASFRHGLRVRVGGQKGVLLHCEKRDGSKYWRVRLQATGAWVWPDDLAVDGPGDQRVHACGRCELPFYRQAGSEELLCVRCDEEQFGTRARAAEDPRDVGPFHHHSDVRRR